MSARHTGKGRPTLRTERLVLSPLGWDHLEDLVALDADPDVMRFLDLPRGRQDVIERMAGRTDASQDAMGLGFWVGHERGGARAGRFVGWWCLTLEGPGLAEVGWRLHRFAWGRGLATEGAVAVLDHGFAVADLDRVYAETMAVNHGSRGVMRKLGMRHVRTEVRESQGPSPGADEGAVVCELTASEWATHPPQVGRHSQVPDTSD